MEASKFTPTFHPDDPILHGSSKSEELSAAPVLNPPTIEEILPRVRTQSSVMQFKNSLIYIQGGTNIALDRMIARFDIVLAETYQEGYMAGLQSVKK